MMVLGEAVSDPPTQNAPGLQSPVAALEPSLQYLPGGHG